MHHNSGANVFVGLDPGRYRNTTSGDGEDQAFVTLDSQLSDRERFKDCDSFIIRCRKCKGELPFAPITDREVSIPLSRYMFSAFTHPWRRSLLCFLRLVHHVQHVRRHLLWQAFRRNLSVNYERTLPSTTKDGPYVMTKHAAIGLV